MATAQEVWDELDRDEAGQQEQTLSDRLQSDREEPDRGAPPLRPEQVLDRPAPDANDLLLNMQRTLDALQKGQRDLNGKFGRTTERLGTMEAQLTAAREAAAAAPIQTAQQVSNGEAPTQRQVSAATANPEEWDRLKEDFPDWAKGVEAYLNARMANVTAQTPDVGKAIETALEARMPKLQEQMDANRQQAEVDRLHQLEVSKLDEAHPDWRDHKQLPAYVTWLHQQPEDIVQLAQSPRGEDAIKFFDAYKAAVGVGKPAKTAEQVQQERTQRLRTGSRPTASQGSQERSGLTLDDLAPAEYWALLDKEERDKRSRRS